MRAASNPVLYSHVNVNMCNYALTIFPTPLSFSLFKHSFLSLLPWLKYGVCAILTLSDCAVFISVRQTGCKFITSFWALFCWSLACSLLLDWRVCVCSRLRIRDQSEAFLHLYPLHISSRLSHHHSPFLSLHLLISQTHLFYLHALN